MMYAQYIATEDVVFTGEGFAAQFNECLLERSAYAYIVPEPGEAPWWPYIYVYFSARTFQKRELAALCRGDREPLDRRAAKGEDICGFRWRLDEVALEGLTETGEAIARMLHSQEVVA